jgi:hypothetical protein
MFTCLRCAETNQKLETQTEKMVEITENLQEIESEVALIS